MEKQGYKPEPRKNPWRYVSFQVTFARPDKDDHPWTRADLYRGVRR